MTEKEFDKKIRNRAMMRENESSLPLWGKEEAWNRIDSSLPSASKKTRWWPAAAVFLLFLLSAGWSVAQYINNERYKEEKELEISQLKESILSVEENNDVLKARLTEEINRKDNEIETLKNEITVQQAQHNSVKKTNETEQQELLNLQIELNERDEIIQSLRNEIAQLSQENEAEPEIVFTEQEDTIVMEMVEPEIDKSSTKIYYIGGRQTTTPAPAKSGLRINLFGRGNKNIEYKSEQSLFSK